MLARKYFLLLAVALIAACSTTPKPEPKTATIKSNLRYDEAYRRITAASEKCYPGAILDHDLYTYKPMAEVSVNTHPWSFLIDPAISLNFQNRNVLHITIDGAPDNSSTLTLSNEIYRQLVQTWLENNVACYRK